MHSSFWSLFLSVAVVVLNVGFLSLSLIPNGEPRLVAAAAACYFVALIRGDRSHLLLVLPVFVALGLFYWGALLAGVVLFSALLAELWVGTSRIKQCVSLAMAVLCMLALLFSSVPSISFYVDAIPINAEPLMLMSGVILILHIIALKYSPARPAQDPLLVLLLSAFTLCYVLTVALLAHSIAYPQAILLTVAGGSVMLAAVVIFTVPLMRGGTLTAFQHIFSLHVPIEKWVADISADAAAESSSDKFADTVMKRFMLLPRVAGVMWRLNDSTDSMSGIKSRQYVDLHCPPLFIRLYTRRRASPWDWFNYYLLARISGEYCRSKQREEENKADNLSRAVYQTGARLTHDIKNILHALTALMQSEDDALVRRQLPVLSGRLEKALQKLQAPGVGTDRRMVDAGGWWKTAGGRYAHQAVEFPAFTGTGSVPVALFDIALDNFIANALIKRQADSGVEVQAQLLMIDGKPALQVQDSGAAMEEAHAAMIFLQPVESATGFGVALYQVRLEAQKYGYSTALLHNQNGNVVFQLAAKEPVEACDTINQ